MVIRSPGARRRWPALVAVASTDEEAEQIARRGAEWTVGSHQKKGLQAVDVASEANRDRAELSMQGHMSGETAVDGYVRDRIIWGTPERVRAKLEELEEEISLGYLLLAPLSHTSFELFTEDVLPHLG